LKKAVLLLIAILIVSTLALAHEESSEANDAKELFENADMIIVPFIANPGVTIDGKIGASEYSDYGRFLDEDTGMQVYLEHDGSSLYVGLKNPGNGWIAIGFGNENMKNGANVIMGYMDNGTLLIRDSYASEIDGEMEHEPVENLGGNNDIVSAKGIEDSLGTTIEFKVPLNSKDKYGRHLEPGKIYPMIIAFNDSFKEFNPTLDEGEIHFEKIYVARQSDDLEEIVDLFARNISPTSAVAAAAFLGISFAILLIAYYPWRKH